MLIFALKSKACFLGLLNIFPALACLSQDDPQLIQIIRLKLYKNTFKKLHFLNRPKTDPDPDLAKYSGLRPRQSGKSGLIKTNYKTYPKQFFNFKFFFLFREQYLVKPDSKPYNLSGMQMTS